MNTKKAMWLVCFIISVRGTDKQRCDLSTVIRSAFTATRPRLSRRFSYFLFAFTVFCVAKNTFSHVCLFACLQI